MRGRHQTPAAARRRPPRGVAGPATRDGGQTQRCPAYAPRRASVGTSAPRYRTLASQVRKAVPACGILLSGPRYPGLLPDPPPVTPALSPSPGGQPGYLGGSQGGPAQMDPPLTRSTAQSSTCLRAIHRQPPVSKTSNHSRSQHPCRAPSSRVRARARFRLVTSDRRPTMRPAQSK